MLLPDLDYDPTESAVPWKKLYDDNHTITFSTPSGNVAYADERLVFKGFSLLSPLFMTKKSDLKKYQLMIEAMEGQSVLALDCIDPSMYDALLIPGGHAQGVKTLLESDDAYRICRHFMSEDKPVAAVCHGVLLLARTTANDGTSVLHSRKTTSLTNTLEFPAWLLTAPWLGRYYRTYNKSVESEVRAAIGGKGTFLSGPLFPIRDSHTNTAPGFIVRDGNYLSARWPGDCNRFAQEFAKMLD